jgi:hypothetical protein
VHKKPDRAVPRDRVGRPAQSDRPRWVPAAVDPRFLPELLLFDFLLRSENFKGSLKRRMRFLWFFSSNYLFGRIGSSGINPFKQCFATTQQPFCPRGAKSEARRQGAIDGGGEAMRAQATYRDQVDCPHPLRRACPNWRYCISQPRRRREGPYTRSKVGAHPRHEAEKL